MTNEIIVVKQLPVIEQRLQQIKTQVQEKTAVAMSLVCTEDTLADVKRVRADLRKDFAALEEERKRVKTAIMQPYDQFEAVYKDCVTNAYKEADSDLKQKIESVEEELKAKKARELLAYFNEYLGAAEYSLTVSLREFVTFERANINVTMSASLKSLKEQAKAYIDRICDDLRLIDTQEHKDEILYEYKKTLNVSAAITTVANRYKAIEAEKAREAERKAREEAMREAEKKVETVAESLTPPTVAEPLAPPVAEEKVFSVRLTIHGTKSQLRELKEFMTARGIKHETEGGKK